MRKDAYSLGELLADVKVLEWHAQPDILISGLTNDSRTATSGILFIAISGFAADGHMFIDAAAANGAAVCICERAPERSSIPYVLVDDSRMAEAEIARVFYGDPASKMTMIGVTGTNGKTTSAFLIKSILESEPGNTAEDDNKTQPSGKTASRNKVGLIGTICNMIGDQEIPTERTTPGAIELHALFAQMFEAGCTHVVMEVSSHSLALGRVAGIMFDAAIYTNLTEDHLDFHKTMESYAAAKAILFEKQTRRAIINTDDSWGAYFVERSQRAGAAVISYSLRDSQADFYASNIQLSAQGASYSVTHGNDTVQARVNIPGEFSVYNSLDALACCCALGMSLSQAVTALGRARGVKGRLEIVPTPEDYTILIDYAHTPDAVEKVLRAVRAVAPARLVVLLGAGGDRDPMKRPLMGKAAAEVADFVIVTSDNPRTEDPEAIIADILPGVLQTSTPYKVIPNRVEAIHYAMDYHQGGDVIVLAGKGHETYQEINHVKHHLDEREVVAEHID